MLIWKTNSVDLKIASFRYRCLLPSRYLESHGYQSCILGGSHQIRFKKSDIIVFVKSFTVYDLDLCQQASKVGVPIIIDICDNIFINDYASNKEIKPSEIFKQMSAFCSAIVTTGVALKDVLEIEVGKDIPIHIIPDGNETLQDIQPNGVNINLQSWKTLFMRQPKTQLNYIADVFNKKITNSVKFKWTDLKKYIKNNLISTPINSLEPRNIKQDHTKIIIWFGNHGAKYGNFGMLNILDIAEHLIKLGADIKFTLVVISNNYEKYQKYISSLPFSTQYIEWNPIDIYHYISTSDVTIVPNSKSPFSICKSANRAVMSLSLGVPVVATKTPALELFNDCIIYDDWESGLRAYLTDQNLVKSHIEKAEAIIQQNYSGEAIAKQWNNVIKQVVGNQI